MNSLYQESFTGKGSLCLDLISQEEAPIMRHEGWELILKNGKLSLKGTTLFSTVQALSFLSFISPIEVERHLGKKQFSNFSRCLKIKNKFEFTDEIAHKIVKLGFNAVLFDEKPSDSSMLEEYGLKILTWFEPDLTKHYSRKWLLKDYLLSLLGTIDETTLFYVKNEECFEELHFASGPSAQFAFPAQKSHFQKLREPEFYPSSFMPLISVKDKDKIRMALEEMKLSPCTGFVLELDHLPVTDEESSSLWAINFSALTPLSFDRLQEMWIKKEILKNNDFNSVG